MLHIWVQKKMLKKQLQEKYKYELTKLEEIKHI